MSKPAFKIALLLAAYLALALLPLALALAQSLPRRPWRDELSSGLAMVAFAMLLMEFLLSGRYRAVSSSVGMDLTMRFHQMAALALLAFVLVHPLLYSLPYAAPRPWDVQRTLTVTLTPMATVTGVLAWILIPALVAMALLRDRLRYEPWRLAHGLMALGIAALGTHHALDTGRYAQDTAMRAFWLIACALAFASLGYAYLVKPLLQNLRRYRVLRVERVAERIWSVVLEPAAGHALRFVAGQFVWLKFFQSFGRITEHPFSIASTPDRTQLEFLIKEAGDFTNAIGTLAVGTAAFVDGPYGNFTVSGRRAEGIVLIAGGVGIAPILGIARALAARAAPPFRVVYADRSAAQLAGRQELDALAARGRADVQYVVAEPSGGWAGLRGRLDAENLAACLPRERPERWLYLVCGPPAMIDAVELGLSRLGIPLAQIVSERFRYATGVVTPRERLTRAVIGGLILVQLLAALAFALW